MAMPKYRRWYRDGGSYFFSVKTYKGQGFLCDASARSVLRQAIEQTRGEKPFEIVGWVLFVTKTIWLTTWIIYIIIRSNTAWWNVHTIGPIRPFTAGLKMVCIKWTGCALVKQNKLCNLYFWITSVMRVNRWRARPALPARRYDLDEWRAWPALPAGNDVLPGVVGFIGE